MLHVLLFVLKILGIILLAVLGVILAGVLLALFVSVRYRADGSFYKVSRGEACISWLFRAFQATVSWEEKLVVTVKVLWLQPFQETLWEREPEMEDTGNEDPWAGMDDCFPPYGPEGEMSGAGGSQEEPVSGPGAGQEEDPAVLEPRREKLPEGGIPWLEEEAGIPVDQEPEMVHMAELLGAEEESPDRLPEQNGMEKAEKFPFRLERLKNTAARMRERLHSAKMKYRKLKRTLTDEENKKTFRLVRRQIVRLIRHLLPQTLKGTLRFGFEDPSYTGQVLAAVSPFYGVYARSFTLIPEFEEKILEGEVHIRGRIRAATVLWTAGRVFLNKNFRRLLRGRGRRKE